jgi:hypothetical protein
VYLHVYLYVVRGINVCISWQYNLLEITKQNLSLEKKPFMRKFRGISFCVLLWAQDSKQELKMLTKSKRNQWVLKNLRCWALSEIVDMCTMDMLLFIFSTIRWNWTTRNLILKLCLKKFSKLCRMSGLQQFFKFHMSGSKYVKKICTYHRFCRRCAMNKFEYFPKKPEPRWSSMGWIMIL